MIQPGIYSGKILDYKIQKTRKEEPEPSISFQVTDAEGNPGVVYWRGSLNNDVGIDIALRALMACGLQSPDDIYRLAEGPSSKLLNMTKVLRLTVVHEVYNGETKVRVKWVNDPEEANAKAAEYAVDKDTAKKMLGSINLRAKFNDIKKKQNEAAPAPAAQAFGGPVGNLDDVPF